MSVFLNKKPKLLGAGEDSVAVIDQIAIAGLSGDATLAENNNQGTKLDIGTTITGSQVTPARNSGASVGFVRMQFTGVVTPANSVMIFFMAAASYLVTAGGSSKSWQLQRDGSDILATFSLVSGDDQSKAEFFMFIDENPPAGTHSYQILDNDTTAFGGVVSTITFIQLTDTHAADITTPATAIKQINSPDSHRTRQTEVIP